MFENGDEIPSYLTGSEHGSTIVAPPVPPRRRGGRLAFWVAWAAVVMVLAALLAVVGGGDEDASAPVIELAPAGPRDGVDSIGLPVMAEPNEGLVDGQEITVTGSGFPAHTQVGIVQCSPHMLPLEGIARCVTTRFGTAISDEEGNVTAIFTVSRVLYFADREIDCAAPPPDGFPASCNIAVGAMNDYDVSGTGPLHFDPDSPIGPTAELELNLVDDLLDYQPVTLTIRDPGAGVPWQVSQCVAYRSPSVCTGAVLVGPHDPGNPAMAISPDGSDVEATVLVRRMIVDDDCGIEPQACSLVIQSSHNGMLRSQRLSFRPGAPLASAVMTLLTPLPALEGQWIEVSVTHRAPWQSPYPIHQCPAGSDGFEGCLAVGELHQQTADGALGEVTLAVLIGGDQDDVDCSVPGSCVLRYVDSDGSIAAETPVVVVRTPSVADPGAPDTTVTATETTVTDTNH